MPGPRGLAPTSRHQLASLKPTAGSLVWDDAFEKRESTVIQLHGDACEGLHRLFKGSFDELKDHWLVCAEHGTGSDAEKEGVSDLAGGAGDCDSDGGFAHDVLGRAGMIRSTAQAARGKSGHILSFMLIFSDYRKPLSEKSLGSIFSAS
jgi:hypothetical protein